MATEEVQYNFLGNSGLKVSNICLGTATFGTSSGPEGWFFESPRHVDEATSHIILDRFVELGGNFVDTANMYSYGNAEKILGNWLASRGNRDDIVVASKVGLRMDAVTKNDRGLSRKSIVAACDASLQRLQTNYIDLYQCHIWDNATPIDETLRTLDDLIRCGKIRYYGFSNVCGWQLQKIACTAKYNGFSPCVSLQQQYSLLERKSELEAFMVCKTEGIGVIPWSPLKCGMLTGVFEKNHTPPATESRIGWLNVDYKESALNQWGRYKDDEKYWRLIDVMKTIAMNHGKTVPQIAIRWLLQKGITASVAVGVTSLTQLEDNMAASGGWEITKDEIKQLDEASAVEMDDPYNIIWGRLFKDRRYNTFNPDSIRM